MIQCFVILIEGYDEAKFLGVQQHQPSAATRREIEEIVEWTAVGGAVRVLDL